MKCASSQNVRTRLGQAQPVCGVAGSVAAPVSERAALALKLECARSLRVLSAVRYVVQFLLLTRQWIDFSSDQRLWFAFDGFFQGRVYLCVCPSVFFFFFFWLCCVTCESTKS